MAFGRGSELSEILKAINRDDFEEVKRLAEAVDEFGYPKFDFNADLFYYHRGGYPKVKTTVLNYVLFGLFDFCRFKEAEEYGEKPRASIFEWFMFLVQLKNVYGDLIIDFNRAVLDEKDRRTSDLFSRMLFYNEWPHRNFKSPIKVNEILKYTFEDIQELFNWQVDQYYSKLLPHDILPIIKEYYNPLYCFASFASAVNFFDLEKMEEPKVELSEEIKFLNASLKLATIKAVLELQDSQGRPVLRYLDYTFLRTICLGDENAYVPIFTKKLIDYLINFFKTEGLQFDVNAFSFKTTVLNFLDGAVSRIKEEDSFSLHGISEIVDILKKNGGKRYLDLSEEEQQQVEQTVKENEKRVVERQHVPLFRDRRIVEIKFQDEEPSPEDRMENVYYIYSKIRYGQKVLHYGILSSGFSSEFFVAPLSGSLLSFIDIMQVFPSLENAHKNLKMNLQEYMTYRRLDLGGRVPNDKEEITQEEKEKIFLENMEHWIYVILDAEPLKIQRYILSKWHDKKDAIVGEFIENAQEELKAKLPKTSDGLRLSDANRETTLMKEWFDRRKRLHVYEPLVEVFRRIDKLEEEADESDSVAYREAFKKINLLLDEVMRCENASYALDYEWFCSQIHIDSFIELHSIECDLRKKTEEEFKQKIKAQKYIEASYQDLTGLGQSLGTYKKFSVFIEKYSSDPAPQPIILSCLIDKIKSRLFSEEEIPQIVTTVTELEKILWEALSQENFSILNFSVAQQVKEAFEEESKDNNADISLCREIVDICLKTQDDYDVLQTLSLKEDEVIKSFIGASVSKVGTLLNEKKLLSNIQDEVHSIKEDSLKCVIVYEDINSKCEKGNLIKLKNIAQAILQAPDISLKDKEEKLRKFRRFILDITENREHDLQADLFLKHYFLWRVDNLSNEGLKSVEWIERFEEEKISFKRLLSLEVDTKPIIDMQNYSRSVSSDGKRIAAMRSVWSAKIKIGAKDNRYFEEFANNTLIEARATLEKHRDNCAIRLLYALAVSLGSLFIYPLYICCRYNTFPLPAKGKMVLHELEQSLNPNFAPISLRS
ncbi:MAG: hypothetical protein K0S63_647 [Gammaproteobacteria bacterium]|jgi:hypothetical protein|nr:hypothetical protein [Gammaproteobacteria bacterium]